ncbi:hypothetical protein GCM10023069_66190 [Shinella granuli]
MSVSGTSESGAVADAAAGVEIIFMEEASGERDRIEPAQRSLSTAQAHIRPGLALTLMPSAKIAESRR